MTRSKYETGHDGSRHMVFAAVATYALAALLVFVLPLLVPVPHLPNISASYVAGFNNRAATVAAAGLSVMVLLITLWRLPSILASPAQDAPSGRLGLRWIGAAIAATALVLGISGVLVTRSHVPYTADAGYFIEAATARLDTGHALYTQMEFAYGPLLLLPVVWLSRLLHCGVAVAYYIALILEASLGLVLLAFALNELPIRAGLRRAGLVLFAFGAISPLLGLNYTFLRFATAMAVLLFATRSPSPWRCGLLLTAGEFLVLLLSPEQGLALCVGILAFALLRAWSEGAQWLLAAALPLMGAVAVLLAFGRPYLSMLASFSSGTLNIPVAPYPHLLIFLFTVAWVVPVGLARRSPLRNPFTHRLLAVYALSLAMLPSALGRCDPLHVFFSGIGMLVLSLVAVSARSRKTRMAWLTCVALLVLWQHYVNEGLYRGRTSMVLRVTLFPWTLRTMPRTDLAEKAKYHLDPVALERYVGSAPVATPLEVGPLVTETLRATHHYHPGYYSFWVDVLSIPAEEGAVPDLNTNTWALLPSDWGGPLLEKPSYLDGVQGFAFPYPERHPVPSQVGSLFKANLATRWVPVERFGPYLLYRKKGE